MDRSDRPDEKLAALRQLGAVNPRPQDVTDELFRSSDFFDPRDLVQVKYEMLRRVSKDGLSVSRAAAAFGFSRQSFYEAQKALAGGGLPGLLPRRRGPRGAHKLTGEVLELIDEALARDSSLRARELARLVRDRFDLSVHPRSIERALARRVKKNRGGRGQDELPGR